MAARNQATATQGWNPRHNAQRRAPLQARLLAMGRLTVLALALGYLGLALLSTVRGQAESLGQNLLASEARAEMVGR